LNDVNSFNLLIHYYMTVSCKHIFISFYSTNPNSYHVLHLCTETVLEARMIAL